METKVLTPEQMAVVQEYLDGKIEMFTATEHQMKVLGDIISDAEKLCEETDAYDEVEETEDCDLIKWYLTKVKH